MGMRGFGNMGMCWEGEDDVVKRDGAIWDVAM